MSDLSRLFANNRAWVEGLQTRDPQLFSRLAAQQSPEYLWIGCSDSRVPANEIVGLPPGELFVHRNVANLVSPSDLNCLSVIQYALSALKVRHIIVTGHYGCGGVQAAMEARSHGLIDHWLHPLRDIYARNKDRMDGLPRDRQLDLLCELNVLNQVQNVCHTQFVQEAWAEGRPLTVHGWIYDIHDGLLKNLGIEVDGIDRVEPLYRLLGTPER